jgi:hypothetical protein
MSLLLNGAKTLTIAGTEMSCVEIYTGEAYTFPLQFTDSVGANVNCTGWTLDASAKFYTADEVSYNPADTVVTIGNLTSYSPTPTPSGYANLTAAFTTASTGTGYLYVPVEITGGFGSPNATPIISLANSTANTTIVVVTIEVTRTNAISGQDDVNKEPIGFIVRYQ